MRVNRVSFTGYNDEQKKRILAQCTPNTHIGRGLTADVYDLGNNTVAKIYRSTSRANAILRDLNLENQQLSNSMGTSIFENSSISFPKQHGAFIDSSSGRVVAVYDKVRGKTFGDVGLSSPSIAQKYIQALDDIEEAGYHHIDVKPDNLMLEDDDL